MPDQHDPLLLNRRELLKSTGMGLGMLGLAGVLADAGELTANGTSASSTSTGSAAPLAANPLAARPAHFAGRAKRVVHFFLNGGPSHVDTFDPKPLLAKYAGQPIPQSFTTERKTGGALASPFQFQKYGASGLEVSELFARTAAHADQIAVIRSMHAQVPNHEPSLLLMNCGDSVQPRPSVGSWVLYGMGTENQNLPGFIALCPGGYPVSDKANWQSGFLPGMFQGTWIDAQHRELDKLIENIKSPHATAGIQRRQLEMLRRLNGLHGAGRDDPRLAARIQSFELAFRMQMEAADAFDIGNETQQTLEMYGDGVHGRQTLIARRLLERGVRYVQLWHGAGQPWDHHTDIEKNLRKTAGEIDQPIAALLTDLKQRGLLDDTLVIWGANLAARRCPKEDGGATTTTMASRSGWLAAESAVAPGTARPTTSVFERPSTPLACTTCMQRSCTCWALITRA
jgi:hypothetical protein